MIPRVSDAHGDLRSDRLVMAVGWIVVGAGVAAFVLRTVNSVPAERTDPRGALATLSFGVMIAAPGVMTLLARHGRPVLILPAAVILVPAAFLSFAGVLLPLLIPAFLLSRSYARHRHRGEGLLEAAVAIALLGLWFVSLVVFLSDTSMVEYRSDNAVHSVQLPTYAASAGSLAALGAGLSLAWWATTPRSVPDESARHSDR